MLFCGRGDHEDVLKVGERRRSAAIAAQKATSAGVRAICKRWNAIHLEMLKADYDVAAPIGEARATGNPELDRCVVAIVGDTVLCVGPDTFELVISDIVDDARNGVGTVRRGGATGNDIDSLNKEFWQQIDIDFT